MKAAELSEILHRVLDLAEQNVQLAGELGDAECAESLADANRLKGQAEKFAESAGYWKGMFDLTLSVATATKSARDMALSNCAALSEELKVADERIKNADARIAYLEAAAEKSKSPAKQNAKPALKKGRT
jgi:hypothetical protein